MKLFSVAAFSSFLFAEEGAAQTIRLRNKNLYNSAGSQRQLQPEAGNIFDGTTDPTGAAINPTEFPVVALSIGLSLPPILTPPIITIPATVSAITSSAAPSEPITVVELSMSAPEAPVLPATIPAIDTTAMPTDIPPQTTSLPQTTIANEFGVPEESMSISMSLSIFTEPTVVSTTTATTTAAATTALATSQTPADVTMQPTTTSGMCMSMTVTTSTTELPLGVEEDAQMSIPQAIDLSVPPLDFIPPIEESAPTRMPTSWFNNPGESSKSSAPQMGKSCVTTIAAFAAAGFHMLL